MLIAAVVAGLGLNGCKEDSSGTQPDTTADTAGSDDSSAPHPDAIDDTGTPDAASDAESDTLPSDGLPQDQTPADQNDGDQTTGDQTGPDLADASGDQLSPDLAPDQSVPDVPTAPCAPTSSCTEVASPECLSLVDNSGKTDFGLRVAFFEPVKPAALASGLLKNLIQSGVQMSLSSCNLVGSGTINVLMRISQAGVTLGGAVPVADPTAGYSFFEGNVGMVHVVPGSTSLVNVEEGFETLPIDLVLPLFLDASATQTILLPLKRVVVFGSLSADQNCLGSYNAEGLNPDNSCMPDEATPQFLAGGVVRGHITLEDADTIVISATNQTLCVLLGGTAAPSSGTKVCARDANGKILFKGDWCDSTNMPNDCQDSVQLEASIAASGIKINP